MNATDTSTQLSVDVARRLTARIRDALVLADELLVQLWDGRGWSALGYDSFAAYCAGELPALQLVKLRADERRRRIAPLVAAGASIGDLAAATGAGRGTLHADLQRPELAALRPDVVISADGRRRQARTPAEVVPAPAAPALPFVVQLLALLGERGPLTALQVEQLTGRRSSSVAPALHRLHDAGRVTYTAGAKRGRAGVYAAAGVAQ
jgi:hypothetical protein